MQRLKKIAPRILSSFLAVLLTMSLFSQVVQAELLELTYEQDYVIGEELQISLPQESVLGQRRENSRIFGEQEITSLDAELALDAEQRLEILTYTLGETLGVVGFEGDFALSGDPGEMVEIVVTFVTPSATSLRLLGEQDPGNGRRTLGNYEAVALEAHTLFRQQLNSFVVPFSAGSFHITSEHHSLFNGVTMTVSANLLESLASLEGVFAVSPAPRFYTAGELEIQLNSGTHSDERRVSTPQNSGTIALDVQASEITPPLQRENPIDFFMAEALYTMQIEQVWDMLYAQGIDRPGYGLRIAVLDTGIDYWHPVFAGSFDEELGRQRGQNFIPVNPALGAGSAVDPNDIMERRPHQSGFTGFGATSHGTHVAGSIAAIAPYATLYHFRVLSGSTPWAIIVSGFEAAHAEGVDIINMSLGADVNLAFDPFGQAINLAVLDGITVVIAAGNAGAHNVGSLGVPGSSAPLSIVVGAGQRGGIGHISMLGGEVLINGSPVYSRLVGQSFILDFDSLGYITQYTFLGNLVGMPSLGMPGFTPFIDYLINTHLDGEDLTGQIAVFQRGFDFTDMRAVAKALNASAWMVVDNQPISSTNSLFHPGFTMTTAGFGGANVIPNFIIQNIYLPLFGAQFSSGEISVLGGELSYTPLTDNISFFSARGPVSVTHYISPDVIAPGSGIVSTVPSFIINSSATPGPSEYHHYAFSSSQGTSMASPAVAGIAALLLSSNPDMPPHEVKARMMNTAVPLTGTPSAVVQAANGGPFYSVFNVGAGFVSPYNMFTIGSTFATTTHDVPHGGTASNQIWLENATMSSLSFGAVAGQSDPIPLTFHNIGGATWNVESIVFNGNSAGAAIGWGLPQVVGPNDTAFAPYITFDNTAALNTYFEGVITFTNGTHQIVMPFAALNQSQEVSQRFSVDMTQSGVRRPIVSGHIRWNESYPEHRHIPAGVSTLSASNTASSFIHIIDSEGSGTVPAALYIVYDDLELRMGSHGAIPVNQQIHLTNFITINTSLGVVPDGIYDVYVRIEHPTSPFFGPLGHNNRIIVTSDRPTIIFDEDTLYFEPSDEAQQIVIEGQVLSPGHELALLHDIRTVESPDWAQDYYYINLQVNLGGGWQRIPSFSNIDWDTGEFFIGINLPANFPGATIQFRAIEGYGVGGTPPTFGANISEDTALIIAPEIAEVDTRNVTFAVDGIGGEIFARIVNDGYYEYIQSGDAVPIGSTILFYGTAEAGFRVEAWSLAFVGFDSFAPAALDNSQNNLPTFTLNNLSFDHHVTVRFLDTWEHFPVYFGVYSEEGGTISAFVGEEEITSGDLVRRSSNVLFAASPYEGWEVYDWIFSTIPLSETFDGGASAPSEFTLYDLQSGILVEVKFVYVGMAVTPADIKITGIPFVERGGYQQLTATVFDEYGHVILDGYTIEWSVTDIEGVDITGGLLTVAETVALNTELIVTAKVNEYVYAEKNLVVTGPLVGITVDAAGSGYITAELLGFTFAGLEDGRTMYVPQLSQIRLTATPASGYHVAAFSSEFIQNDLASPAAAHDGSVFLNIQAPPSAFFSGVLVTVIFSPNVINDSLPARPALPELSVNEQPEQVLRPIPGRPPAEEITEYIPSFTYGS